MYPPENNRIAPHMSVGMSVRSSVRPSAPAPTSSPLMLLALCIFCCTLAVNVFGVYYNYLDFRYHWSALEISLFYSALGLLLALMSSAGIRFLIPKRLSEGQGTLVGLMMQVRLCFVSMRGSICEGASETGGRGRSWHDAVCPTTVGLARLEQINPNTYVRCSQSWAHAALFSPK